MHNPDGTIDADALFSHAVACARRYGKFAACQHLRLTNQTFISRVLNAIKE